MQIYTARTATFSKSNALVIYSVHVVWLKFPEERRSYLADHENNFLGLPAIEIAEMRVQDRDLEVDESVSLHGLTTSKVVLLEGFTPQKS